MRIDAALSITDDELAAVHASRHRRGLHRASCIAIDGKLPPEQRCWWIRELMVLARFAEKRRPEHAESLRRRARVLAHATLADWPADDIEAGIREVSRALAGRGNDQPFGVILPPREEAVFDEIAAFYFERDRFPLPAELKAYAAARGNRLAWGTISRTYSRLNLPTRAKREEKPPASSICDPAT